MNIYFKNTYQWFLLTLMKSSENYFKYYDCDKTNTSKHLMLYISNKFRISM